jgi:hypothetical protein
MASITPMVTTPRTRGTFAIRFRAGDSERGKSRTRISPFAFRTATE